MEKRCYQLLGLAPDASRAEVRAAFHRLARRCHPDTATTEAADPARFQALLAAYRHLCTPQETPAQSAGRFTLIVRMRRSGLRLWRSLGRCLRAFFLARPKPCTRGRPPVESFTETAEVGRASHRELHSSFARVLAARQQAEDLGYVLCADGVIRKRGTAATAPGAQPVSVRASRLSGVLHGWWGVLLMMAVNGWGLFRK